MSGLLSGKKILITGVANERSIAWGVAKMCHEQGAELAFSYQGEVLKKRLDPLAQSIGAKTLVECDATNDESLDNLFSILDKDLGELDCVLHCMAFSDKNELEGRCVDTTRANFKQTMDISCFSLIAIAKRAEKLMKKGGSIVTLTYYGSEKVIVNYNVMGIAKAALEASVRYLASDLGPNNIRVNSISAGPIRTLAASGISDFKTMLNYTEQNSPLRKNVTTEDVAGTGVYLFSDLSKCVTGENIHVDSGYHIIGMPVQKPEEES